MTFRLSAVQRRWPAWSLTNDVYAVLHFLPFSGSANFVLALPCSIIANIYQSKFVAGGSASALLDYDLDAERSWWLALLLLAMNSPNLRQFSC